MDTATIVARYYELANSGKWDDWCDLFAANQVMDEQLAGHIEGRDTLRGMMAGFPAMYSSFTNTPKEIIVEGEKAAVVSHISAVVPDGGRIEAGVMNYFHVIDGEIAYMANFHDTQPFRAVLPAAS